MVITGNKRLIGNNNYGNISVDANVVNGLIIEMDASKNTLARENAEMEACANKYKAMHVSESGNAYERVNSVTSYKVKEMCNKFQSLADAIEYDVARKNAINANAAAMVGGMK